MELAYFNARIRGLKGRLLKRPEYEALLSRGDVEGLAKGLRSTGYRKEMEVASAVFKEDLAVVSEALRMNMLSMFGLVWEVCPEAGRTHLNALFSTWEVFNLKTLIRGIDKGAAREELMDALVPVVGLDRSALRELGRSRDMAGLVRTLAAWGNPYGAVLKKELPGYLRSKGTYAMELSLDRRAFEVMAGLSEQGPDRAAIRAFSSMRADAANIMTLVKTAGEGFGAQAVSGFFMDGGKALAKRDFIAASGEKTRERVLTMLAGAVMNAGLRGILLDADKDRPGLMEEALDNWIENEMRRLSVAEPLGMALAFAYVYMKIREIKNLRLMVRARAFGIPADELRPMLVF